MLLKIGDDLKFRIKNWRTFQHYKHRRPSWIKLHKSLLDDRQWRSLSGDAAKALIDLWLVASERDGLLPELPDIAFRLRISENEAATVIHQLEHWVEQDASTPLADCYQPAFTEKSRVEKIREEALPQSLKSFDKLEVGKGKKPPRHGATGKGWVYVRADKPEWAIYSDDFGKFHGHPPSPDQHGGKWFRIAGEASGKTP